MSIDIQQLNNLMSGIDFRSCLNTNFQVLKDAILTLSGDNEQNIIYTDTEIIDTNYSENTIQICCNKSGVKIEQFIDGEWQTICFYEPSVEAYMIFNSTEAGIGYEIVNADNTLEGKPFGYYNGTKVLAGTIQADGEDPIQAVGWYINGKILKIGRIKIDEAQTAGSPVYVLNETGGWTTEVPIISGQLIQVIGFISDDGNHIEFDIQPWCIVS